MRWQGFAVGVLSLTLLEVVVSSQAAAQRTGGIFQGAANLVRKFLDPAVPAFAKPAPSSSGSAPNYGGGPQSFGGSKTGQAPTPGQQNQIQNGLGAPNVEVAPGNPLPPGVIAA